MRELAERTGAERQLDLARGPKRLPGLVDALAEDFSPLSPGVQAQASRSSAGTGSPAGERSNA